MTNNDATESKAKEPNSIALYWNAYGGWAAFIRSPYLYISIFLLLLTYHYWSTGEWWDQVLTVLPSVLGFTLGGFAVFLGFGDSDFKAAIAGQDEGEEEPSPYMSVCATFLHFILVQVVALIFAVCAKSLHFPTPDFLLPVQSVIMSVGIFFYALGYWLFLYGLCIAAAAALGIFTISGWYDNYQSVLRATEHEDDNSSQT